MFNIVKHVFLSIILILLTFFVSCSSNKTKTSASLDSSLSSVDFNSSANKFEIEGSSDEGRAGGLATVYFDYKSSSLRTDSKRSLEANAKILKEHSSVTVLLEGHCDERGGSQYNLALGEKRARVVQKFLGAMGVSFSNLSTQSYGKEKPVSYGHDEESWSQNRRVNFVILSK